MIKFIVILFIFTVIFLSVVIKSNTMEVKRQNILEKDPYYYSKCKYVIKDIGGENFECIECNVHHLKKYGITCNFNSVRG